MILNEYHKDCFPHGNAFQECGEISLHKYISEGSIQVNDIQQALLLAQLGECSISHFSQVHIETVEVFSKKDNRFILTNFIIQLLCLIFSVDNPTIAPKDIINAVVSKKKNIQKHINETRLSFRKILSSKYGQETIATVNIALALKKSVK